MGEGMACGGLPFPGTGCPIPDVDYLCLLCIDFYVWDAVSIFNHLPRMFLSTEFSFWITDWTCCHGPHLHAILRIISRGVSGSATDSPCGVWGRGWTTCLLHDSPLFGAHISKWEFVCKFGVIFHIFIISCLCSWFQVRNQWFFYSVITFSYTKCFVHSYTVDVVFTLSYWLTQLTTVIFIGRNTILKGMQPRDSCDPMCAKRLTDCTPRHGYVLM